MKLKQAKTILILQKRHLLSYIVMNGDKKSRGHVQVCGGNLLDQPLGVLCEAGHKEELVVINPVR